MDFIVGLLRTQRQCNRCELGGGLYSSPIGWEERTHQPTPFLVIGLSTRRRWEQIVANDGERRTTEGGREIYPPGLGKWQCDSIRMCLICI